MGQAAQSSSPGCWPWHRLCSSSAASSSEADAGRRGVSVPRPAGPTRARTSNHSVFRLRCAERDVYGSDRNCPVRLVIFDLDETLTLVTFMTPSGTYQSKELEWARKANFESPWVEGSRIDKLQQMLRNLAVDLEGQPRTLAILTKNQHRGGVMAILNLLRVADLADHFSAIWTMPWRNGSANGAYQDGGTWKCFEPPVDLVHNHKADLLHHVARNPQTWFPQLTKGNGGHLKALMRLRPESIVLVDDQRANFHSDTGLSVIRYCKVARYDAHFLNFGLLKDMGGIGAHDDADYETLKRFVEDPWLCKETLQVRCLQRDREAGECRHPVELVVFDFDETITLATFMPKDEACATQLGWLPSAAPASEWSQAELVAYNFETPFVDGSRVAKLRRLFADIARGPGGQHRALAVLTRNESGVVAVLNLLKLAGLADPFCAIWTLPQRAAIPSGAYQEAGQWRLFEPPVSQVNDHKADVLHHVVQDPSAWFPQLKRRPPEHLKALRKLRLEGIVLVDDERANFRSYSSQAKILRFCKVARYDEPYRDCGPLNQMGGLGAHSDADYETLRQFLDRPWDFPYEPRPTADSSKPVQGRTEVPAHFQRSMAEDELLKAPRRRPR